MSGVSRSPWQRTWRADPRAAALADRHYSRGTPGASQFAPPGVTENLNDRAIAAEAREADCIVCAWGASPGPIAWRLRRVFDLLPDGPYNGAYALKLTKDGQPWHPLYVRDDTDMVRYRSPTTPTHCGLRDRPWQACAGDPDGCERESEHYFDAAGS